MKPEEYKREEYGKNMKREELGVRVGLKFASVEPIIHSLEGCTIDVCESLPSTVYSVINN